MKTTHYTYKVTHKDTGEYYIGSRSCSGLVSDDFDYKGSMVSWKVDKSYLIKQIIDDTFSDRNGAILSEQKLILDCINDALNRNYNIPGIGFHNTNRVFDSTTRKKMSSSRVGNKNPMYGKTHTDSVRDMLRKIKTGLTHSDTTKLKMKTNSPKKRKIEQYTKTDIFITEYDSIRSAADKLKIDAGDISKVCNGKQLTAGSYKWKFK
jgi:group I intron endonuclease